VQEASKRNKEKDDRGDDPRNKRRIVIHDEGEERGRK